MSTQEDIQVTYDVSNEFFSLWLDARMNYSSALFLGTDNLEEAQLLKLQWICNAAKVTPDKSLLDIGCGWGSALEYAVREVGVKDGVGITLSPEQYREVVRREIPGVRAECVSYQDFQPGRRFDALISIGMFEHIATPEESRSGKAVDVYRDYFRRAWEWAKPGAWFALQSVVGGRLPRRRDAIGDLLYINSSIFPGATMPRLEWIFAAVNPYWEVVEVFTRREHYMRTTAEWLRRLQSHERTIRERWGDERFEEYQRYLGGCVRGFEQGYHSLAQLSLRRMDEDEARTSRSAGRSSSAQDGQRPVRETPSEISTVS